MLDSRCISIGEFWPLGLVLWNVSVNGYFISDDTTSVLSIA